MYVPMETLEAPHTADALRLEGLLPGFRHLRRHPWCNALMRAEGREPIAKWSDFDRIIVCDSEFYQPDGHRPKPHIFVAVDVATQLVATAINSVWAVRAWLEDLKALWVFFYAPADLSALLAAGATLPAHVLDLHAEFRCLHNSARTTKRAGLLSALAHYGIEYPHHVWKKDMQTLAGHTEIVTGEDAEALKTYCIADTLATARLFAAMQPSISLDEALLRGRYTKAVAKMETAGIPLDVKGLEKLRKFREPLTHDLIKSLPMHAEVYRDGVFYERGLAAWAESLEIPWPQLASGKLALTATVFADMAARYPEVAPLAETREVLGQLRAESISVGPDGRNRCMLSPFGSKTGRNQPSNSKYIWGQSRWMRGLIQPVEGTGIAYIDWRQQEFGIAAALSGDRKMLEAYRSDVDPYIMFARYSGVVSPTFTRYDTGGELIRNKFKACLLGAQYGMGARKLAGRIGTSVKEAQTLLGLHRKVYPTYWRWLRRIHSCHELRHRLSTLFGWEMQTDAMSNYGTIINFPVQANAAEMLRLACCCLTEAGLTVIAPVHDAVVIEAPLEVLEAEAKNAQSIMAEVSAIFLESLTLDTDVSYVRYPCRYVDKEGQGMWNVIQDKMDEIQWRPALVQSRIPGF